MSLFAHLGSVNKIWILVKMDGENLDGIQANGVGEDITMYDYGGVFGIGKGSTKKYGVK